MAEHLAFADEDLVVPGKSGWVEVQRPLAQAAKLFGLTRRLVPVDYRPGSRRKLSAAERDLGDGTASESGRPRPMLRLVLVE